MISRYGGAILILLSLAAGVLGGALVFYGYLYETRIALGVILIIGSALAVAGYWRLKIPGSKIRVLLGVSILRELVIFLTGFGILGIALSRTFESEKNSQIIWVAYIPLTAGAFLTLVSGVLLFFGASRGWLARHVRIFPWR